MVKKSDILILLLILVVATIFLATTTLKSHSWGGDFSMYLHHAQNIATGKPYAQSNYIYNPLYAHLAPKQYPPVFPLLLSPFYNLWKNDLFWAKLVVILFFVLSTIPVYLILRKVGELTENKLSLFSIITLYLFSPFIWIYKDQILSDAPYMFFQWLTLLAIVSYKGSYNLKNLIIIGFLISVTYYTRTVGIVSIPVYLLFLLINKERNIKPYLIPIAVFVIIKLIVDGIVGKDSSYLGMIANRPLGDFYYVAKHNITTYVKIFTLFWFYPGEHIKGLLNLLTFIIGGVGFLSVLIKRRITILELFLLGYGSILLFWPYIQDRFIIPLFPLYLYYFFTGLKFIEEKLRVKYLVKTVAVLLIVYFLYFPGDIIYRRFIKKEKQLIFDTMIDAPAAQDLFNYIRNNTSPNDTIIFAKPRVLAHFTDRYSSVYPESYDPEVHKNYYEQLKPDYIILSKNSMLDRDMDLLKGYIEKYGKEFLDTVYTNEIFIVFKYGKSN